MSSSRHVLLVHTSLQVPGGSTVVAAWTIEALKREHDVTVATWGPVDLEQVNRFCGTAIHPGDVTIVTLPRSIRHLFSLVPAELSRLRHALMMRVARARAARYDVLLTSDNEMDFGRPAIQYIHYPTHAALTPGPNGRRHPRTMRAYGRVVDRVSGLTKEGIRSNLTLTNSDWTGQVFRALYGGETRTVHPPVLAAPRGLPWSERANEFVCIGRFSAEKNHHRVIDIVGRVRQRFPDVRLHLVGPTGRSSYSQGVLRRADEERAWIDVHDSISRDEMLNLMGRHRYGIHGMSEEHFGLAPAELVAAGCIVFVPRSGGQVEVVGNNRRLTFDDADEAVTSIVTVMSDRDQQRDLLDALSGRRDRFSHERFVSTIGQLVNAFPAAVSADRAISEADRSVFGTRP